MLKELISYNHTMPSCVLLIFIKLYLLNYCWWK